MEEERRAQQSSGFALKHGPLAVKSPDLNMSNILALQKGI